MMDILNQLLGGFATAGTPINLLWALAGCALGTAIGVLPGLGPAVTVAMLLPITGQVEPTASMIFFAGIYYGAMYGGSTTSILLNTPGETGTMVTALEGFKMAKHGRAGAALATSAIGSFVAGTHRHHPGHAVRAHPGQVRGAARPARVFLPDAAGLHHGERRAGPEHAARPHRAVLWPGAGPGRHRPDHRPRCATPAACWSSWTASRWCWWRWVCLR